MKNDADLVVPAQYLPWIGVLLVFALAFFLIFSGQMVLLGALAIIPVAIFFVDRLDRLFILVISLFSSALTLPVFPESINAFYLLSLFLCVVLFARKIIGKAPRAEWNASHTLLLLFGVVIMMTACIRGFGLRMLGSTTWGGSGYIHLFIMIVVMLLCDITVTKSVHWKVAFYSLCILSILPVMAQLIYAATGGAVYQQYYLITPDFGAVSLLHNMQDDAGVTRVTPAQFVSNYGCLIGLIINDRSLRRRLASFLIIAVSILLAGLSGHRLAMLYNLFVLLSYGALNPRGDRLKFFAETAVVAAIMLIGLTFFADLLPLSFQRSLSWIPFANISMQASIDASNTTFWRLEIWRMLVPEIPKYLLCGKGFAFHAEDIMGFSSQGQGTYEDVIAMHNYHNGPLSLLIDLGLAGFLVGSAFILVIGRMHYRYLFAKWKDESLRRLHLASYASYVSSIVVFFFIFGDARSSMIQFIIWAMIMEGLVRTDRYFTRQANAPPLAPLPTIVSRRPAVLLADRPRHRRI